MIQDAKPSQAIVLSGGASQGAYHAGVLKALFRGESPATNYEPLQPDVFTGTSAGSFNAAALLGEIEAREPESGGVHRGACGLTASLRRERVAAAASIESGGIRPGLLTSVASSRIP